MLERRRTFWIGFTAVCVGVALQLPMYVDAASMGYRLVGMVMGSGMWLGMGLVAFGLWAALYSLVPPAVAPDEGSLGRRLRVEALDDAPINKTHVGLLLVMAVAATPPSSASRSISWWRGCTDSGAAGERSCSSPRSRPRLWRRSG